MKNPSKRAVDELYSFLENHNLGLTLDGCFLAYKSVGSNYLDKYSGTFDNKPGAILEMPRNSVDDESNRTCSHGFHVGALEYSGPGGWYNGPNDKVIIVKVNPADAVSVPADHSAQKLRVCKYEVVGDYKGQLNKAVYSGASVSDPDYNPDEYESDDVNDEDDYDDTAIYAEDIEEGDIVSFTYTKSNGDSKKRYAIVDELDMDDDSCLTTLIAPENKNGEVRRFVLSRMTNVKLLS